MTLNSRPFLINMDCTSTPSLRGGNDEEGEAIKRLVPAGPEPAILDWYGHAV